MERKRKWMLTGLLLALTMVSYGQVGPAPCAISHRDATWLNRQGFPMAAYGWQNETINQGVGQRPVGEHGKPFAAGSFGE